MSIVALGIDLAKNVFALHGVDETGKVVLRKPSVKREKLLEELRSLPPCLVGMEACGGAHDWARKLKAMGHDARMMAPPGWVCAPAPRYQAARYWAARRTNVPTKLRRH